MDFYGMLLPPPIQTRCSTPPSEFKDIGSQLQSLSEKPGLRRFADHVQDDEKVSGLLEDLQKAIFDYQVCLSPWHGSRC